MRPQLAGQNGVEGVEVATLTAYLPSTLRDTSEDIVTEATLNIPFVKEYGCLQTSHVFFLL